MSEKTIFSQLDDKVHGVPDGLCQDEDYACWSARWGAGKVIRLDENGQPDLIVEFPTAINMTSCIFGGKCIVASWVYLLMYCRQGLIWMSFM
jgi:sugar lactone lactonase YvrE